jgi:ABC-type multidrug transport system ATPase subunit
MRTKFAIETKELTKRYGDLVAVDNLNLTIDYGEVFGLLGPNGAGKTTIISMLCTIINPSSGKATVNGFDISRQSSNVRHSIGIVFQDRQRKLTASRLSLRYTRRAGQKAHFRSPEPCGVRKQG